MLTAQENSIKIREIAEEDILQFDVRAVSSKETRIGSVSLEAETIF